MYNTSTVAEQRVSILVCLQWSLLILPISPSPVAIDLIRLCMLRDLSLFAAELAAPLLSQYHSSPTKLTMASLARPHIQMPTWLW